MNEIKRLQQLAGILTEIKVNDPTKIDIFTNNTPPLLDKEKIKKCIYKEDETCSISYFVDSYNDDNGNWLKPFININKEQLNDLYQDFCYKNSQI